MLKNKWFVRKFIPFILSFVIIFSTSVISAPAQVVEEIQFENEDSTFFLKNANIQSGVDDYYPETADINSEDAYNQQSIPINEISTFAADTEGDPMVYLTQKWLNQEYGDVEGFGTVTENGKTGWNVVYGLTRALQHELGITSLANNFGPTTARLYGENPLQRQDGVTDRKFAILQGALWCKGYNPGYYLTQDSETGIVSFQEIFNESVENAIIKLKKDAGFTNPDGIVTTNVMKALLSMDSFKLLSSYYGGKSEIRAMQQQFNRKYEAYTGLVPCDGVYGRNTNKALIYAIQAEEGLPVGTATGNFGPTTKNCIPEIPYSANGDSAKSYQGEYYNSAQIKSFIELMQFALFTHGFGDGDFDGKFDSATKLAVREFQSHYALPKTGIVDINTWMSLLISSGNPDRTAVAADCATILNAAKAKNLYDNGYRYIGRYLTGTYGGGISKALTVEEANIILDAGLRFFPIYQTSSNSESYFTLERGTYDAEAAITASINLGLPKDTIIYFAVDFDAMDYQITDSIIPYFEKVYETVSGSGYKVGVYGARNVCSRVAKAGYSCSSFVGDMSTGFSGNLGFKIPDNWAFSQFANLEGSKALGTGDGRIEIDKNAFSGRDQGVGELNIAPKKAIYVLPGYMGSRLYDSNGEEYWADQDELEDDITDYILKGELSNKKDILRLDKNGENSKLHTDIEKDLYGTPLDSGSEGTYYNLVTKLKKECPNYDVIFFPYNWLADLNDSVTALQDHINSNGYQKVVFVTHSTGGLLASAYIAKNYANKKKTEKAILIAAPLYGTYSSLNPIETGKEEIVVDKVKDALKDLGNVGDILQPFALSRTYKFVRKAVHNSPTTYQLLPSIEYLKLMPQLYTDEFNGNAITNIEDYYSVLNGSSNINSNLTNGNKRSHKKFRNNIGDIVSVLQEVDTILIGTSEGHKTLAIAEYGIYSNKTELMNIIKSKNGDGTVLAASAFALSPTGEHILKYKDFANDGGYDHFSLATKSKPIKYVCDYINGKTPENIENEETRSSDIQIGDMSQYIKIHYNSDYFVTVKIFDTTDTCVAEISDNDFYGFEDNAIFNFTPLVFEENENNVTLYMPNSGYKMLMTYGNQEGLPINFDVKVSTLNEEGFERGSVTKTLQNTSSNGWLVVIDGCAQEINDENLASILDGLLVSHYTEWEIPKVIELDIHDSKQVVIAGDESQYVSSLINWDSSNTDVATISQEGIITALNYGETIITAQYGGKICSSIVTVTQDAISVNFENIKMIAGERMLIKPLFTPSTTTEKDIVYSFDDGNIISIDEFGAIHALSAGVITVTGAASNGVTDTFTVSVRDPAFESEKGDVNGDETINIIDLVRMKKFLCNIITLQRKNAIAADMSLDEIINSTDLVLLRTFLLNH